uniref:NADH-ubiquinone oxidoreductase chain 6 n=1 Tax=Callitettix braconoides TaxID=1245213 RepID=A0A096VHW6_9HEMI|nr:NADH dehydrogenase subunit 6 [Callitettix braconoides]AFV32151.1 NADH dehydrogenase subunit 6 [Callitettix braconoides]
MKLMIIMMFMFSSTLFLMMKHPLSSGFMLLMQTMLACMMNSMNSYSYWFSYILFIIFIGGMMVLFIYIASIASNEKFKFSMKTLVLMLMTMAIIISIDKNMLINFMNETLTYTKNLKVNNKEMMSITKMFNYPMMMLSMMSILYLLLTLIAVVKITDIEKGPLRMKN